jgi:AcrR family transcriptional regulator
VASSGISTGSLGIDATAERRAELLAATTRVIARRGYAGTRFQDVAEEAGVAVGTLQHHFGTRSRMLAEALEQWIDDTDLQLLVLRNGTGDAWERLHRLLVYVGTRIGERNPSWQMWLDFTGEALKDPELRRAAARSNQRWFAAFADTIRDGIESGVFAPNLDGDAVAGILSSLMDGLGLQVFAMESDISGAETTARLTDAARELLHPRSA